MNITTQVLVKHVGTEREWVYGIYEKWITVRECDCLLTGMLKVMGGRLVVLVNEEGRCSDCGAPAKYRVIETRDCGIEGSTLANSSWKWCGDCDLGG